MSINRFFDKLRSYVPMPISLLSQTYHVANLGLKEKQSKLETGMLVISVDIDVGAKELGTINKGKNDANISNIMSEYLVGKIEEIALPLSIDLFSNFGINATFAIRGQLVEVGGTIFELILRSSSKHDIGAHGYYHREFTKLTYNEAESELKMLSKGFMKYGIIPRTFIFPINSVAHLGLVEKYGYRCYRSTPDLMKDSVCIRKQSGLYSIPSGLFLGHSNNWMFLKKCLDISVARKLPIPMWFHLWNFGATKGKIKKNMEKQLVPILSYAEKEVQNGTLTCETMLSATERMDRLTSVRQLD